MSILGILSRIMLSSLLCVAWIQPSQSDASCLKASQSDQESLKVVFDMYSKQCPELLPRLATVAFYHCKKTNPNFEQHYMQDIERVLRGEGIQDSVIVQHMKLWGPKFYDTYVNHPDLQSYSVELKEFIITDSLSEEFFETFLQAYEIDSAQLHLSTPMAEHLKATLVGNTMFTDFSKFTEKGVPDIDFFKLPVLPPVVLKSQQDIAQLAVSQGKLLHPILFRISYEVIKKRAKKPVMQWGSQESLEMLGFYDLMQPLMVENFTTKKDQKRFFNVLYHLALHADFSKKDCQFNSVKLEISSLLLQQSVKHCVLRVIHDEKMKEFAENSKQTRLKLLAQYDNEHKVLQAGSTALILVSQFDHLMDRCDTKKKELWNAQELQCRQNFQTKEDQLRQSYVKESDELFAMYQTVHDGYGQVAYVRNSKQQLFDISQMRITNQQQADQVALQRAYRQVGCIGEASAQNLRIKFLAGWQKTAEQCHKARLAQQVAQIRNTNKQLRSVNMTTQEYLLHQARLDNQAVALQVANEQRRTKVCLSVLQNFVAAKKAEAQQHAQQEELQQREQQAMQQLRLQPVRRHDPYAASVIAPHRHDPYAGVLAADHQTNFDFLMGSESIDLGQ